MNVIEFVVLPILVHIAEIRIPMRNIKSGKKEKMPLPIRNQDGHVGFLITPQN
jgi:hypothetical protein